MFENRSAFEQRGAAPTNQFASLGVMASVAAERPQEQQQGMMSTIMASVGMAPAAPSAMGSMASMASTVDQNASMLRQRPAAYPMGSMASTAIPEEQPGFMSTIIGTSAPQTRGYDPNVHA